MHTSLFPTLVLLWSFMASNNYNIRMKFPFRAEHTNHDFLMGVFSNYAQYKDANINNIGWCKLKRKEESATILEYKAGNNVNFAYFVYLWKTRIKVNLDVCHQYLYPGRWTAWAWNFTFCTQVKFYYQGYEVMVKSNKKKGNISRRFTYSVVVFHGT